MITVHTDGSAIGNPGPGGWAVVIQTPGEPTLEYYGCSPETTNNRMELHAAIFGLEYLGTVRFATGCAEDVHVVTDSQYVKNGIAQWIHKWKQNGWRSSDKKPVHNQDLWVRLDQAVTRHQSITWGWTKGHVGDYWNERADELAGKAARQQISNIDQPNGGYRRLTVDELREAIEGKIGSAHVYLQRITDLEALGLGPTCRMLGGDHFLPAQGVASYSADAHVYIKVV